MKKLMILGAFLVTVFAASQTYAATSTVPAVGQRGVQSTGTTAPHGVKTAVKTAKAEGYKKTVKVAK